MQINGLSAFRQGSGFDVSLAFHIGSREELEPQDMDLLRDAIVQAVQTIQETLVTNPKGVGQPLGSREPEPVSETAPANPPVQTRRRPASSASAPDAGTSTVERAVNAAAAAPAASPSPTGRRRPSPATPSAQPTATETTPATTVRRRPPATEPAPAPVPVGSKEITDQDLSRACSDAATVMGPVWVQGFVKEFQVTNVADLAQENRREFLTELKAELDKQQ